MKQTVTLHSLAFDTPSARLNFGTKDYGVRKIVVEIADGEGDTEAASAAFRATNIEDEFEEISRENWCYSLSVGDVVEIHGDGRSRYLIVDHVGFFPVSSLIFSALRSAHRRHYEARRSFNLADDGIPAVRAWKDSKPSPLFDRTWVKGQFQTTPV